MSRGGSGVRPVSKTSIEISFQYEEKRCRERIKLPPTPENLKRAALHKAQIEQAIIDGIFDYATTFPNSKFAKEQAKTISESSLLSAYLENWLKQKSQELHSSTIDGYEKIIRNHIIPAIGQIALNRLSRTDVRDWISQANVSNKTISNRLSPLRAALDDAVMDELIDINPIAGWKWKNRKQKKKTADADLDPFNKKEQDTIFSTTPGQALNLFKFLLWTGIRPSEAAALNWDDVDIARGTVSINKGFTQAATEPESTKTDKSTRTLKLLPPALTIIRDQQRYTYEKGKEVFQNPYDMERWAGDQPIRKKWTIILKHAKVRYRRPYQLRHTFASMMISSGENMRWLSNYLGHSDLMTTLRVYAHWLSDADPNAGMKAVEIYDE